MAGPPGIKRRRKVDKRRLKMKQLLARPEIKYLDVTKAATEINYDAVMAEELNAVAAGTGESNRIGDFIVGRSIQIKGLIDNSGTTLGFDSVVRLILVLAEGVGTGTLSEVIESTGAADDVFALRSISGFPTRYNVLWDETFVLGDNGSSAGGSPNKIMFSKYFKLANQVMWNTAGSKNQGDLRLFALSDVAAAATGPLLSFMTRFTFYDK